MSKIEIDRGTIRYYYNNKLHRTDGPAVKYRNGDREWYLYGLKHREDGPAVENVSGKVQWLLDDMLHREDGPADYDDDKIIKSYSEWLSTDDIQQNYENNVQGWYIEDMLHRTDGPAYEDMFGNYDWYQFDYLHRINGPALHEDNTKYWYQYGKLHRDNGPAVITADESEYWLCGVKYEYTDYCKLIRREIV